MSKRASDLRYTSVLFLMAFFAVPATVGPCLASDECPRAVASKCHEEESGQSATCCCEMTAVSDSKRLDYGMDSASLSIASPQLSGVRADDTSVQFAIREPAHPPSRGEPLFLFYASFLT